MKLNFVTGFAVSPERTSFKHPPFCANDAKTSATMRLARIAAASCNAHKEGPNKDGNSEYLRKAALAATENRCGTTGPQAWAEFCLAYCKRLGPLLAMPVTKFGCSWRTLRFIESGGEGLDDIQRKWSEKGCSPRAIPKRFSIARK